MEARAIGRYLRVTPRKAKLVLDAVRGKSANEALGILKFTPNEAAKYIRRLLESAIANAENNYAMDRESLRLVRAYADNGPMLKRIHPRAMGRAFRIMKRMSHITVIVAEDESLRKAVAAKPKAKRPGRRAKGPVSTATPPPHGQAVSSQSAQERTEKTKKAPAAPVEPKAARKAKAVKPEAAKPEEKLVEEPIAEVEAPEQAAEAPEAVKPEEQVVEEPPTDVQAPDQAPSQSAQEQTDKVEE